MYDDTETPDTDLELISSEELEDYRLDSLLLGILYRHGLDNWEEYGECMEEYREQLGQS